MANRRFFQFRFSAEAQVVDLWCNISIGASGAPTLTENKNKGISSITRVSAGIYDIFLSDNYTRLLNAQAAVLVSSGVPTAPIMNVITDSSAAATPKIRVQFSNVAASPAATDPANGDVLLVQLTLKNSSI